MAVEIRPTTIAELELQPNIYEILDEYAAESAIKGLPHPSAKAATYKNLEALGVLHTFAAFEMDELVGYITVLLSVLAHFDQMIATTESFFVRRQFRKTGAGLRLLRHAENFSREKGSPGILVSAPLFGDLGNVLPQVGYTPTSCIWFKNFSAPTPKIPKMKREEIEKVAALEAASLRLPQIPIPVDAVLHAGMYSRTVKIPAGVTITGALIKVPTILIVDGDVTMYAGDRAVNLNGHNVLTAEAGRKQAFVARSDVYLTMMFPSSAVTLDEAEEEFTDEADMLQSRQGLLDFSSGEQKCLL